MSGLPQLSGEEGGLDLSQVKTALAGGDSGKVISAGKVTESLLWERIDKSEMPQKKPLPEGERAAIKARIAERLGMGTRGHLNHLLYRKRKTGGE
ncbi:MAG: hypothetical protein EXS22_07620 [Pedosphaera sp.]|nr:hypothetical protein [Pedosphaera sp.]